MKTVIKLVLPKSMLTQQEKNENRIKTENMTISHEFIVKFSDNDMDEIKLCDRKT